METVYKIKGGSPIIGRIRCLGAKNFTTKAMVAAILANTQTTLFNVPAIGDTQITIDMLNSVGVKCQFNDDTGQLTIDSSGMSSPNVTMPHSGSNRIPILLLGALLHRFTEVQVPVLGGCHIGARLVNYHLEAICQFGGEVIETSNGFIARRQNRLVGTHITLPYPSVGATETCLYLAVLARGRSVISNAALEPEILELIVMLRAMGAIIFMTPGREIRIEGVNELRGTKVFVLGDRIEAASWASLACATDGNIIVDGVRPDTLGNFFSYFQQVGGGIDVIGPDTVQFYRRDTLRSSIIETDVYPGFSTDWQQPFAILLTQASGVSVIHETVYEKRFDYLEALTALGAKTQLTTHCLGSLSCRYRNSSYHHSAIITGPTKLEANNSCITVPDLRAGLAYIIAAAVATGTTILRNVHNIERGYGYVVPRLQKLNLDIEKCSET